jgi:hypothetical protein
MRLSRAGSRSARKKRASMSRKVAWTRMGIPRIFPSRKDHLMGGS